MLIKLLNMVYKNLVMVNINKKEKYKTNTICTIKFNYKVENYSKLIYNINIKYKSFMCLYNICLCKDVDIDTHT